MGELEQTVSETVEQAGHNRLNTMVALLVALTATFMALCNVKDGNIVQGMAQDQTKSVDTWAYYQAKGTKLNLAEAMKDQLVIQDMLLPATTTPALRELVRARIARYTADSQRFEQEKHEIKQQADALQADYDRLNIRDDQLDMAEALLSIALALFGITALTRKRFMLILAAAFAGFGFSLGVAAFAGLNLHPAMLARWLS